MIEVLRSMKEKEISDELARIQEQLEIEEQKWNETYVVPYKRFSWLQKNVTRRKEYIEYTQRRTAYEKMVNDSLGQEPGREAINALSLKAMERQNALASVKNMTLDDLGYTFESAIAYLQENNMPAILNEADKAAITVQSKSYTSTRDLMCVHKTKYAPLDNHINSAKEANAQNATIEYTLGGKKYSYVPSIQRNTVHLAINGEVENIAEGNDWNNMPYTVLIPFDDIPKSQIMQAPPMDTFTEGGVNLTSRAWILCPKGHRDLILKHNPGINVIEYDAENAKGFANVVLQGLGYNCEEMTKWSWVNKEHDQQYREMIRREGFSDVPHSSSKESSLEDFYYNANIFMDMINNIKKDNLVKSPQDVAKIENDLKKVDNLFWHYAWDTKRDETSVEKRTYFYEALEFAGIKMPDNLKEVLNSLDSNKDTYIKNSELETILSGIPKELASEFAVDSRNTNPYFGKADLRTIRDTLTRRFILTTIGMDYEKEHKNQKEQKVEKQKNDNDEIS